MICRQSTMAPHRTLRQLLQLGILLLPFTVRGFILQESAFKKTCPQILYGMPAPDNDKSISADQIYFDIEAGGKPLGRLLFRLTNPSPLPLHTENIIKLCKGERRSIEPLAHYVGCEFEYSPLYVEDGMGRYRWGHVLKGRGRNAIGRSDEPIVDKRSQSQCTHSCFGGQYYGDKYVESEDDPGVFLTVPVAGPGRGSSKLSIVRVGESPQEWRESLLVNSGVVGRLDPSSLEVLQTMARQMMGPPKVVGSGVL